jgi:hypothetical protein
VLFLTSRFCIIHVLCYRCVLIKRNYLINVDFYQEQNYCYSSQIIVTRYYQIELIFRDFTQKNEGCFILKATWSSILFHLLYYDLSQKTPQIMSHHVFPHYKDKITNVLKYFRNLYHI